MKNLKIMNMLLGGLLVLGSLTACSDNDEETTPPTPDPVPTSVKVDYKAEVSQQLLDVANVTVRYVGEDGRTAVERMTSPIWTMSVEIPLPGKAGLNIVPKLKSGLDEGEYTVDAKGEMTYNWLENGQQIREGLTVSTPLMEGVFYASGLGAYLNAIASQCQVARAFTADYTVNPATITIGTNDDDNTQSTGISDDGATGDNR
jgi:hypothetical protein